MLRHKVHEITLKSGLKGIIVDTPKTGVVVAEVSFRAGEFLLSKEKWETAHLMEHIMLGANKSHPKARDFQADIEQNGAYSNASTGIYDITYEVEAADFEWQRVVKLLLDAISTPLFLKEEFESEMSNVREELISRSNNHFRHLNAYLRQSMGLISLTDHERIELLDRVTKEDVYRHYKRTHTLSNARFIIAGNFNGKYDTIEQLFSEKLQLPNGSERIAMPQETAKTLNDPAVIRKPSVPNIYMYLDSYVDRSFSFEEKSTMQLVSTLLTETMYSRIFGEARERGLTYSMGSGSVSVPGLSGWWMGAQVSKTNAPALMRLVRDELLRLQSKVIDSTDFDAAKKHLLGKTMLSGQTASRLVSNYGNYYVKDEIEDLNKLPNLIKNAKKEASAELMSELLSSDLWGFGLLGSTSLVPARKLHSYLGEVFSSPQID